MHIPSALSVGTVVACLSLTVVDAGARRDDPRAAVTPFVTPLTLPAGADAGMYSLANDGANGALVSWLEPAARGRALRFASYDGRTWSEPRTIVEGEDLFSNWADHPSVAALPDGRLVAQWPVVNPGPTSPGSYNNSLRIAVSGDRGASWQEVFADGKDNVHSYSGFVSLLPGAHGLRAVYLTPPRPISHDPADHRMTLSHTSVARDGQASGPAVIDADTCSCCPTAIGETSKGPIAAYRDHEPGEIRDIAIVRFIDGAWTTPRPVHRDGWEIHGCPTNGPAIAANGMDVAVAWFTAAGGALRLKVAFSTDAGATFGTPVIVDDEDAVGRPAIVRLSDGAVAVAWLARASQDQTRGELRLRRVTSSGASDTTINVGAASPGRISGMPQMIRIGRSLMLVWRGERGGSGDRAGRADRAGRGDRGGGGDRLSAAIVPVGSLMTQVAAPASAGQTGTSLSIDPASGNPVVAETVSVAGEASGATLDTPSAAASRLGLTARETPATVSVITFAETQSRGLATTTEALARVPAVVSAHLPSTFATAVRGFSGSAVSTLFDGTRITTSSMVMRNFDSWTFERIEVLKGPASVLYGEGALAGAINFVAKRPDFARRRGEALVSFGSMKNGRVALGSTGPIADGTRAAYRADVVLSRNGGYIDDNQTQAMDFSGGVDLKLSPSATLAVSVDHFRDDYDVGYWGTPLVPRSVARDPSDIVTDSRGWVLDKAMRDVNFEAADGVLKSHSTWVRGRLDWRLSPTWRLTNEAYGYDALREWKNADIYGFDAAASRITRAATAITHDHQFYGNRLTIGSDSMLGSRRNRVSFGVEANRNGFFNPRRFGATTSVDPFAPDRGVFPAETPANFPGAGNFVDFDTTLTLVSLFVEDAYSVAPRLTVVAGGRYDRLDVDRRIDDRNTGAQTTFARLFDPMSGRIGVVFDLERQTQLFAQYTSAVAPVSTVLLISQTNAAFDLTTGRSWEAGVKSTRAHGRVEMTASVFEVEQDKILTRDPDNFNVIVQGGRQSSTGVEFTVAVTPTPALRIDANLSLMDVRFEELIEAGGANRAGNVPPNVPERSAGVWATYRFTRWPLTISGGMRGQGRFFTNNANTTEVAGYALLDAQAGWRLGPGEITVRGKNLTDRLYAEWSGSSANQLLIGMPRMIEASYRFSF